MSKTAKNYLTPRNIIIAVLLIAGILIPTIIFVTRKQSSTDNPQASQSPVKKKKVTKPVNEIPVSERPYVLVSPTLNREVDVTIKSLNKEANELEFLAEYQYGTSLGGNENAFDLTKGIPATKQFALYSRSAGGKTSYEEDVKGGTLTLKFANPNDYWLKQDWTYYDRANSKSTTAKSDLKSRDEKFMISGKGLESLKYVIIYNAPGYPKELPGTAGSDLYTFQSAGGTSVKTVTVSIEGSGTIYSWDGSDWQEAKTASTGGTSTAEAPLAEAYIVISQ